MTVMSEPVASSLHEGSFASSSEPKRHAACDECRKRKLKCSGEPAGCSRCIKQSITCRYSVQKPMGRPPKKRARTDDEGLDVSTQNGNSFWPSPDDTPPDTLSSILESENTTYASQICPFLFWKPGGDSPSSQPMPDLLAGDENHNHTWRPDRLKNPNVPVPSSSSPWPDFSTVSEATAMPFPAPTSFPDISSLPLTPPSIVSDSTTPQCTCLSYLYLCLSHISSVASFPINSHTLCSLYIAARTARDVIRCQACPQNFATGVQNVMFTGTLLTVVADAWLRVYHSDPVELGMQSAPQHFISLALQSPDPAQAWSDWLRQVVRQAVVGGSMCSSLETPCSTPPDLLSLIREVENRQRRWHQPGQHPFPQNNPFNPEQCSGAQAQPHDEKELLCLRVVGSARAVLAKFNFESQDFPEGVVPADLKPASG